MTTWKPHTLAIHEAGHAVTAIVLGYDVAFIDIHKPNGGGLTRVETCPPDEDVIITAAGGWAQLLFSDEPPTWSGCTSDLNQINTAMGIVYPCPLPDRIVWREELRMIALRSVIAHEREIHFVADYLVVHGSIGQEDGSGLLASEIILDILDPSRLTPTLTILSKHAGLHTQP